MKIKDVLQEHSIDSITANTELAGALLKKVIHCPEPQFHGGENQYSLARILDEIDGKTAGLPSQDERI